MKVARMAGGQFGGWPIWWVVSLGTGRYGDPRDQTHRELLNDTFPLRSQGDKSSRITRFARKPPYPRTMDADTNKTSIEAIEVDEDAGYETNHDAESDTTSLSSSLQEWLIENGTFRNTPPRGISAND